MEIAKLILRQIAIFEKPPNIITVKYARFTVYVFVCSLPALSLYIKVHASLLIFQNFSSKWSLVFSDFNYDNFYIKDNNLYIVDAEDMLVTDTEVYPERQYNASHLLTRYKIFISIQSFKYKYIYLVSLKLQTLFSSNLIQGY